MTNLKKKVMTVITKAKESRTKNRRRQREGEREREREREREKESSIISYYFLVIHEEPL